MNEREYIEITDLTHRKKYAQFFTPEIIAEFMCEWVLEELPENAKILEPAFGLGIFSRIISKRAQGINVTGYDIDKLIFGFAKENIKQLENKITLHRKDYVTASWRARYDGIICNPPYMKFHDYDNSVLISQVNEKLNIKLNGFTNLYTLFLLKSISQLKVGGRLAYIVPSEFLNSDYGVEVKRVLLKSGTLRHVIIVDFKQNAFDDALTTACILLCQKSGDSEYIKFSNVSDVRRLSASLTEYREYQRSLLSAEVKWKNYYEYSANTKYGPLIPFSTVAKVSRGIATGANEYFTFRQSKIERFRLHRKCFRPCICHSVDVKDYVFSSEAFKTLERLDKTVFLFDGVAAKSDKLAGKYIQHGVEAGIDKKYLTASRKPWYAIERRLPSPIWVSVFNRKGLRFVRNLAGVYNLTTFHCVYDKAVIDADILFAYLITDMAKEIFMNNSRQYGNGLVKFEPNDLNKGYIVDLRILSDEEKQFILKETKKMYGDPGCNEKYVTLFDDFFRKRFSAYIMNQEEG